MQFAVILYYKYVHLLDPESVRVSQRALCERLGLKGRILLAEEGINGTLSGTTDAIDAYIAHMDSDEYFGGIAYKRDPTDKVPFPRLRIKVRPEIVTLGVNVDLNNSAPKLTPYEFHQLIQDPDVVLFDARNDYESAIGKFAGAITPDINLFKDLPAALSKYNDLKDKTVVTYCTGGIRCEKASALMQENGFNSIYQLEGGIIEYAKKYPEGAFEGECFVFDDRMRVAFNDQPKLMASCRLCNSATNTYKNCSNVLCNELMLVCEGCNKQYQTCSAACGERLSAKTINSN